MTSGRRKVSTELVLEAAQYLSETKNVAATTRVAKEELSALGHEFTDAERELSKLAITNAVASKEMDNFGDNSRQAARDLTILDERIDATKRKVALLGIEFAATGDKVAGKRFGEAQSMLAKLESLRSTLGGLENDARPLEAVLEDLGRVGSAGGAGGINVVSGGLSGAAGTPILGPVLGGAIAGAVVSLGPILASELGGVIAGAVGTAAVAGGVLASIKDPTVQSAFTQFTGDIKRQFFAAGSSFVEPVRESLAILDEDFASLHLDQTFAKAAPYLKIIVQGIGELAKNIMPGLNAALSRLGPYAKAAEEGFADLGLAISYLLDRVTQSKGSLEGLRTLFAFVSGLVVGLADLIYHAGQAFDWFVRQNIKFFEAQAAIADFFGAHGTADNLRRVADKLRDLGDESQDAGRGIEGLGASLTQTTYDADRFTGALKDANDAVDTLLNTALALDEANNAVGLGFIELRKTLQENGKHWNDGTKAAYDNRDAIDAMIHKLQEQRDAAIASGGGTVQAIDQANAKYNEQLKVLLDLAGQAGATKAQLQQMAGTYTVTVVTRYETQQQTKANANDRALALASGGGRASGGPMYPGYSYTVGEQGMENVAMYPWGAIVTPAAGGQSASPVIQNNVYIVDPATGATRRASLVNDALGRGVPQATVKAAYP